MAMVCYILKTKVKVKSFAEPYSHHFMKH